MEEHPVAMESRAAAAAGPRPASAPRDLREWIARAEPLGHLQRVKAEVDWDEEMGAITYMAHQTINAPALLFERIVGCPPGYSALWNLLGSSLDRFALAIGEPAGLSRMDLVQAARGRFARSRAPVVVDGAAAPINENVLTGAAVDVRPFPSARHWPLDGGRYIGTADAVITRDPEGGWHNVGTYRMMVHDRNHVGLYLSPGKDARLHIDRYAQRGEPCEVAAVWGVTPAMFIVASQTFSKSASEYDVIGGIMGAPLELTRGVTTGLLVPARAEIVMEGVIQPEAVRMEGPFGEFTGYYGRPEDVAPVIEVTAIRHRNNPILTHALMADYPANECALLYSVARATRIWNDLDKLGVPGIKGIYVHPAAAGGFGMTIVSLEQRYAGHAPQVLALAAQCPGGAYYSKWIIAVDEDVDPSNMDQVVWALATRCNPVEDIDILRNTWSTWLDPTQNPPEERPYGSKALINACKEHKYIKEFSRRTKVGRAMYERVARRWAELGFAGPAPALWALEDDAPRRRLPSGAGS
jgi:4-hydroxy-3-polyprenylbenzoate decarboxylase